MRVSNFEQGDIRAIATPSIMFIAVGLRLPFRVAIGAQLRRIWRTHAIFQCCGVERIGTRK